MNFTPKSTAAHPSARQTLKHILLVMKLTTFLLIIALVQASAKGYSQITLHEKNAPLAKVFKEIKQQSGYAFIYENSAIDQAKISLDVNNASLESTLIVCFANLPLTYKIVDKAVVIQPKETSLLDKVKEAAKAVFSNIEVTGRILDEQGLPIPSATVTVKGTSNATITDAKGYFILKGVADKSTILISVIGYEKRETPAKTDIGEIKLVVSTTKLDEVQIIPYGETTQRLTVGNISSVSAKEIEEQPVRNPLLALEGKVPGLLITQANGIAGGGVTVRIQGTNSLESGNDPLFVIDGIPYFSQMLPTTSIGPLGISGGSNADVGSVGNPLNYINPNDIESIEVLKDASATAIYGSRAANGAILITTKKGKVGAMKVDMNLQEGFGNTARHLDLMNTQQYLDMRREAFRNDGLIIPSIKVTPTDGNYDINGLWDQSRNTDWQKTLLNNTIHYTNANASMSGGNSNYQYFVSGTYHRETSPFAGDFSDQQGGVHFNINASSNNQKFKATFTVSYLTDLNRLPADDLTSAAVSLAPDAPPLYNPDGTLNWALNAAGNASWVNPLQATLRPYENHTNNLSSSSTLSYNIVTGLNLKTTLGYNRLQTDETVQYPFAALSPSAQLTGTRSAQYSNSTINLLSIEPQLTYQKVIFKGKLNVLIGGSLQTKQSDGLNIDGSGYNSDAVLKDLHSAASMFVLNSIANIYKYNALFGRFDYNWRDKYILEGTLRRDGSSRFGPGNQFHDFWSIGGAWIFSDESFLKNSSLLSLGKFKASYGTTGNDQIGDYTFLTVYNPATYGVAYQGVNGLAPTGISNPYIQWEETHKLSVGVDLGLLNDRILLSANYAKNTSSNLLTYSALPLITGFEGYPNNLPATVQNTDLELSLTTQNFRSKNFRWSTNINLTVPKNKLVKFDNIENSQYGNLVVGQSLQVVKVWHYLGVNPQTGIYVFQDANGNPTSSPVLGKDNTKFINANAKYYGGMSNSLSYKNFDLDVLIQFTNQTGFNAYLFGNNSSSNLPGSKNINQSTNVLTRWQNPGDITSIEKFSSNGSLARNKSYTISSDAVYANSSYARFKNLSISYRLPNSFCQKLDIRNCQLFVQGQDLLTFSVYKGIDPEALTSSLPPLRVLTAGVKIGL